MSPALSWESQGSLLAHVGEFKLFRFGGRVAILTFAFREGCEPQLLAHWDLALVLTSETLDPESPDYQDGKRE
jgi:hypothetical protein